ncbi:MAG: PIG-L family deacetylase [Jatrophihabitans sp.]|nr:MAG: PIG-L family deacetylase [Jatrophihabitans sp.]
MPSTVDSHEPLTMSGRVQVVVAHPDDETFGCGSLLLHARAAGATTAVCCATRGEAGGTGADLGAVRERELREAAAVLGVDHVDLLGFLDSGMSGPAAPATLVGAPVVDVTASVRAAVDAFGPDVLVTLDASDGHRDHARIRDVTIAVARPASARSACTPHRPPRTTACRRTCGGRSWPTCTCARWT